MVLFVSRTGTFIEHKRLTSFKTLMGPSSKNLLSNPLAELSLGKQLNICTYRALSGPGMLSSVLVSRNGYPPQIKKTKEDWFLFLE